MYHYTYLHPKVLNNHEALMASMARRFSKYKNTEEVRGWLESLEQGPDQSLEELAQEVKQLTHAAYPGIDPTVQERECIRSFLKAIRDDTVALQLSTIELSASGEPMSFEEILAKAVSMRARCYTLGKGATNTGKVREVTENTALEKSMALLHQKLDGLQVARSITSGGATVPVAPPPPAQAVAYTQYNNNNGHPNNNNYNNNGRPNNNNKTRTPRPCFTCGQPGHWHQECPVRLDWIARGSIMPPVPPMVAQPQQPGMAPQPVYTPQPVPQGMVPE